MTPRVVGVDLSLTSTGLADSQGRVERVQTKATDGDLRSDLRRQNTIINAALDFVCGVSGGGRASLVVIEGPAYGTRRQGGEHARAGCWWRLVDRLMPSIAGEGWLYSVVVATPAQRAMYATGVGNASKDKVLAAAIRRYPAWDITGNDVADAVVLAAIGARLLGHPVEESLPQSHLRALAKLALPT